MDDDKPKSSKMVGNKPKSLKMFFLSWGQAIVLGYQWAQQIHPWTDAMNKTLENPRWIVYYTCHYMS